MAPSSTSQIKEPLLQGYNSSSTPDYFTNCSWLSYLFFAFPFPVLKLGNSKVLDLQDLPPAPSSCKSEVLVERFLQAWEAQSNGERSIVKALWKCLWKDILKTGFFALLKGVGVLSGPIFLYFFVDYASGNERFKNEGIILVVCLALLKLMENLGQRHWYFGVRVLGGKIQSIIMGAVYQKELKLSSKGRRNHGVGEIVNYISVDVHRLLEFGWRFHWSWVVILIFIGSMSISSSVVGMATLPAAILVVVIMASVSPLIKSMQKAQMKFMSTQDERLRTTTEVLQGMKIIKLQAWEEKFDAFIQLKRQSEYEYLAETQHKRNYTTIIYWLMPTVLTCVVLISSLLLGKTLTSTVVFTVLATFRIIQDPVRMAPEVLATFIQAQISFDRLQKFLQEDELPVDESLIHDSTNGANGAYSTLDLYRIRVDNATLSWDPEGLAKPSLEDLNLVVKKGEKVAVCGAVGAGKTSLLLALLGEIPKLSGSVHMCGRVAYVSQTAWIQTLTVRDNILFGKPYDKARYKRVLKACALEEDVKNFSHGDLTEIGERGVNLSGGQKQRIQLARAVYNDADIYLLDDPFSAVDAQTASILFHDCVMGALRDKTVVLVTHQVEFLPSVDTILVMREGKIKQAGTYDDLLLAGDVFRELISAHEEALQTVMTENKDHEDKTRGDEDQFKNIQKRLSREESLTEIMQPTQATQLVQNESVEMGNKGLAPYLNYIQISKGHGIVVIMLLSQVLFSGAQVYSNLWLAQGVSNSSISSAVVVGVYSGISTICVLAFVLRSEMIVHLGLGASKLFFQKLMSCIMKAPMSFFDATPSGRILNRASVDMSVIDLDIPFAMSSLLGNMFDVLCIIVVTCIVTWQIILILLPLIIMTHFLQSFYGTAARELNRINSTTKAPIINNSAETISGSATIRAFKQTEKFRKRNLELIDQDVSAYIYKFAALEWMVLRIELGCTCVLVGASSLVLFQKRISGGLAGLAVTYALALGSSLAIFSIWRCFLAIYILSVERIKQYLDLPMEAPAVIESNRPPPEWPTNGEVCLDHLEIRYRPNSPLVLKGITCTFRGGQKVGVVGRTGSGKTTLISALFRLVEPCKGRILIDGIDICSIGLHDLRFKLGIIPQEPVLFQGTVRTNLDPLNQYADINIWEALKRSQLADVIEKLPLGLDSPVSDQGENWSAGQRQLFCLGRVLLKQSKVLVLDEATASIDSATDALLQAVIREEFGTCSVITVAHRIPTVIDSDMVLALRDGVAMEFDSPKKLIEQKTSLFALLVAEYWAQSGRNSANKQQ